MINFIEVTVARTEKESGKLVTEKVTLKADAILLMHRNIMRAATGVVNADNSPALMDVDVTTIFIGDGGITFNIIETPEEVDKLIVECDKKYFDLDLMYEGAPA